MNFAKYVASCAAIVALCSTSAMAQVGDTWHVTGQISGNVVALNCRFLPRGSQLEGSCTDVSDSNGKARAGKVYKLTQGSLSGKQIQWAYKAHIVLMSFDVVYSGVVEGNRISGIVTAAGRKGNFTAVKR